MSGATSDELRTHLDSITRNLQQGESGPRATAAMASLAESIQGLVQHMRADQKTSRELAAKQELQQQELQATLNKLNAFFDRAEKG
jgi:uncharacterized tellurite resistance protein B-like protein